MKAGFSINSIIEESIRGKTTAYRVLWTDGAIAYVIDIIDDDNEWPYVKVVNDIKWAMYQEFAVKLENDPYCRFVIDDSSLSESAKDKRDINYSIIEEMISKVPDIFSRNARGKMVRQAMERFKVSKVTINALLKRYWRGGQTKDALVPNFDKRGGRGKEKQAKKKMGANNHKGIIISEDDKKNIQYGLKKYYNKGTSLETAYNNMLKDKYSLDIRYDSKKKKHVILDDADNCPTIYQFKYRHMKQRNLEQEKKDREGEHNFLMNHTPRLGASNDRILGPGYEYQIDSTIGDVYLLSDYNPEWIIGRPVIYIVIDSFSQMIVGLYVGLEGPSWIGQMMAIANCVEDKVKYCERYGVPIKPEEWPSRHLPSRLKGDRGEHASKQSKRLSDIWGLQIDITAPYRPDWKGLVENMFKLVHDQTTELLLPGQVVKKDILEKRKGRQYVLDASLTVNEFTEIMINQVRKFNKRHLQKYQLDEEMLQYGIKPIPLELFTWGSLERPYYLKDYPEDLVKLSLLPTGNAIISNRGLSFEGVLLYSSESIMPSIKDSAILEKSQEVEVCYDPRNMNKIYILSKDGRSYKTCELLPSLRQYKDKSLADIQYLKKHRTETFRLDLNTIHQIEADDLMSAEQIIEKAEKRKKDLIPTTSKSKRIKDIPKNREFEKNARRAQEVFNLGDNKPVEKVVESKPPVRPEGSTNRRLMDMLIRKQKELTDE